MFSTKLILIAVGTLLIGGGLAVTVAVWDNKIREIEQLKIANEQSKVELKQREKEFSLLENLHKKAQDEVDWARDYVSKQEQAIQDLRQRSSSQVKECLALEISADFLR